MDRRQFLQQAAGAGFVVASITGVLPARPACAGLGGNSKLKWHSNLKTAQKQALQQDKPMLIVFGATWCPPCRKLESDTLADKKVVAMIEQSFVPVHLDYDKEPRIVKVLEIEKLPSIVVLSPEADLLHRSEGFSVPKDFQAKLTLALEKRDEILQVRASDNGK